MVGIGASAGGLQACRALAGALPADCGAAFILVQHLDPTHESMLVELLASHTKLAVRQAGEGMPIEPGHLYVIPPGAYLSVSGGGLHVSEPLARHGSRMPFDFLLLSLSKTFGARAICVVLSGTGADGSVGLQAVSQEGGLVIAQEPGEAGYDGMPRSAIATGAVNKVLPVAKIAAALVRAAAGRGVSSGRDVKPRQKGARNPLLEIIDLLRTKTAHDFRLYKPGTLQRRTERRMGLAGVKTDDMAAYLAMLRGNPDELSLLAGDLLINVTGFFRDPAVFDLLASEIIPALVQRATANLPLRIWIAGCSTGEETYSLAMLFCEHISAAGNEIKLQLFASDVDPTAVATARDGLYPDTIEASVSAGRLARFFSREDHGYRISSELRGLVVFTVQDLLADPPFSRLDMVSCRNLLIYLLPEAQTRVMGLFHFALREGGILLLGNAETVAADDARFEAISKSERIYRHIGSRRPGDFRLPAKVADSARAAPVRAAQAPPTRPAVLAELCRRLVVESYAPATVLINRKNEWLYSLGPMDLYLKVASGHPMLDLLAMARDGVRTKLRAAMQLAIQANRRIVVTGGRTSHDGKVLRFDVAVQPVVSEGEELLLVCFIADPRPERQAGHPVAAGQTPLLDELQQELEATRLELQGAIRNLEVSSEEQKAVNEEALSVSEEYQATNEELLTSKEELQSLNEELTALNGQLQETLERQRTTSNDLQNILYSTNVATLFLDSSLNIRFFTPATRLLFNVIASDVGRPLGDLSSLAADSALLADARTVLQDAAPIEREVKAQSDAWYIRRILPYRAQDNKIEGVVITFVDITQRKQSADALDAARQQALQANAAKSRFLAAASHDLRQPLQTLALLQGLLAKTVAGERSRKLVTRFDETLGAMSGMLNALLDINQIDAGTVRAEPVIFSINDLLLRLGEEFTYLAQAKKLDLRVVPCGLSVESDPRLLEQMIRNLVGNALKYTEQGRVLLGCRRRAGKVSIEIWDTGVGIPEGELQRIFEEYHQLDSAARERSRGLGLGLSIVQRLSVLLGHQIRVRSTSGKGSMFAIEILLSTKAEALRAEPSGRPIADPAAGTVRQSGTILVVEDDPDVRELLALALREEGHRPAMAADGVAAMEWLARGTLRPDLILADFNLPNGMDGLQLAAKLREKLHREVPVVILTGDISTAALREIARHKCVQMNKPVKLRELAQIIQHLLAISQSAAQPGAASTNADPAASVVFVVDDDRHVREAICSALGDGKLAVEAYESCEAFLEAYRPGRKACLLIDAYLPGMKGLELLRRLRDAGDRLPAIMITGNSDVAIAVQAMRAGALDFIEKPIGRADLLASVERAIEQSGDSAKLLAWRQKAAADMGRLTPRERQIMDRVLAGNASKVIAADLGISQRTVENHRAAIMKKTGSRSLPELARLAVAAS